jgi:hypothetical protein
VTIESRKAQGELAEGRNGEKSRQENEQKDDNRTEKKIGSEREEKDIPRAAGTKNSSFLKVVWLRIRHFTLHLPLIVLLSNWSG